MNNQKKYRLRKRAFLSREKDVSDFVIAIVEDTTLIFDDCENENWKWSHIDLSIGDGYDRVSINFSMENHQDRAESVHKIRQLCKIINEFREALEKEAKSMNARPGQKEMQQSETNFIEIETVA